MLRLGRSFQKGRSTCCDCSWLPYQPSTRILTSSAHATDDIPAAKTSSAMDRCSIAFMMNLPLGGCIGVMEARGPAASLLQLNYE
ncbi:Uncharacterised protein [Bordetella pertussis]|nr:Uncharacterised protein [Bordetella pertussis]